MLIDAEILRAEPSLDFVHPLVRDSRRTTSSRHPSAKLLHERAVRTLLALGVHSRAGRGASAGRSASRRCAGRDVAAGGSARRDPAWRRRERGVRPGSGASGAGAGGPASGAHARTGSRRGAAQPPLRGRAHPRGACSSRRAAATRAGRRGARADPRVQRLRGRRASRSRRWRSAICPTSSPISGARSRRSAVRRRVRCRGPERSRPARGRARRRACRWGRRPDADRGGGVGLGAGIVGGRDGPSAPGRLGLRRGRRRSLARVDLAATGELAEAEDYRAAPQGVDNPAWAPWRSLMAIALDALGEHEPAFALLEQELVDARRWGAGGVSRTVGARAHPRQRAVAALGPAGVTGAAAVAQQVQMQLELGAARGQRQHLVVHLGEAGAGAEQAEPGADPRDVGVDRDVAHPEREQQHAGGGLAPDAGQRAEVLLRLGHGQLRQPIERQSVPRGLGDRDQDVLDPGGLDLRDAARPDRLLDLVDRRLADVVPVSAGGRAAACRRRRGCDRWSTATGPSGSARRSDGRAGRRRGSRRRAPGARGSRGPARARALEVAVQSPSVTRAPASRMPAPRRRSAAGSASRTAASTRRAIARDRRQQRPGERVAGADRAADRHRRERPLTWCPSGRANDHAVGAERQTTSRAPSASSWSAAASGSTLTGHRGRLAAVGADQLRPGQALRAPPRPRRARWATGAVAGCSRPRSAGRAPALSRARAS